MASEKTAVGSIGGSGIPVDTLHELGALGGGGGVPAVTWKALLEQYSEDKAPIIVELYQDPLTRPWEAGNKRIRLHYSISNLERLPLFFGTSAVVVRRGKKDSAFDPQMLYKVTLYDDHEYNKSRRQLALNLGVYPDLVRFNFEDKAKSVLIEMADPRGGTVLDEHYYYDVSSYYKKHD